MATAMLVMVVVVMVVMMVVPPAVLLAVLAVTRGLGENRLRIKPPDNGEGGKPRPGCKQCAASRPGHDITSSRGLLPANQIPITCTPYGLKI